jgi:uncharacterized membrane protein YgcG
MTMQDQFTPSPEDQLEDALAMLAAGIPVADILAGAGDDADWLRPLLEVAAEVKELRPAISVPSPEASLQRMLAYGQKLAANSPPSVPARWSIFLGSLFNGGWLPRLATGLVSALFIVVLLGGTLTVLAQRSLPGQPLYALKRAGETLRLNLTLDPEQRGQLLENFNQQRQTEAKLLLEQNRVAAVSFSGRVDLITGSSLRVDGLVIQLTSQTKVSGILAVGAQVEVEALTQPPDQLVALAVTVVELAPPTPTPLPSPTSPATSTPSPTAMATSTPTGTATRSLASDADTLQLPTFTPTATPTDAPTNTPTLPPPPVTATPPPTSPLIPSPAGSDAGNTNENGNEGINNNDNVNGNDNADDHGNDNGSDNSGSGGEDNSGSGSGKSGSGSDNSGSGSSGSSGRGGSGDDK